MARISNKTSAKEPTFTQAMQFGNWSLDILTAVGIGILAGLLMMGEKSTPHGVATFVTPLILFMYIFGVMRNLSLATSTWQKAALWGSFLLMASVMVVIALVGWGFFDGSDLATFYLPRRLGPH